MFYVRFHVRSHKLNTMDILPLEVQDLEMKAFLFYGICAIIIPKVM